MKTDNSLALDALPPMPVGDSAPENIKITLSWRNRAALNALGSMLSGMPCGGLTVVTPDGTRQRFGGRQQGPEAQLEVYDYRAIRRLLTGGDLGFAQSYIDGEWSSPDLLALMNLALANRDALDALDAVMQGGRLRRLLNRVWHRLRDNSKRGSKRNIAYHYDLGNEFYSHWLDPSMTYSSAILNEAADATVSGEQIEAGQWRKYQRLFDLAGVKAGDRILEVGCGWGGFMQHAASRGCQVDGLTLSREQLQFASERMQQNGLDKLASASFTDYRDSQGQYEAVVSIEMLEAVGEARWPDYFSTLYERLKPGAAAVIQVITIAESRFENYRRSADFIQRHVFPGGMLPTPSLLDQHARAAGLQPDHAEQFGVSYAQTLVHWRERFEARWPELRKLGFDERFRRLWRYYLIYCEAGFRSGETDVGIYRFRKPA